MKRSWVDRSIVSKLALGACLVAGGALSGASIAEEKSEKDVADMSDPLAVYTQVGFGATNRGLNLKVGQTYDTGSPITMGMNLLEVKGFYGESLGWDDSTKRDDSVDSFRYRNFQVNTKNGRGSQLDINFNLEGSKLPLDAKYADGTRVPLTERYLSDEAGNISYAKIQALPKMGPVNLYPLAGVGADFSHNALKDNGERSSGYSVQGFFGLAGLYSKIAITDKLWLNYNPFWFSTVSGSELYKDYGLAGKSNLWTHEAAISYQFTPRFNVRAFANWIEGVSFNDGNHRLEFNYQL